MCNNSTMTIHWHKRKPSFIRVLRFFVWPFLKGYFRLEVITKAALTATPTLYISNHNIGALIESHSILFEIDRHFTDRHTVFGFTHPSIFKVPGFNQYFSALGAVHSTYEIANEVFKSGNSLLIFPGGNKQALRSVFDYDKNSFRDNHGWAKIAKMYDVNVVPITFRGSHFVNPVLFQSSVLPQALVIPSLLGIKWLSVSIGQIAMTALFIFLMNFISLQWWITLPLAILVFSITPLVLIFPSKVTMTLHHPLATKDLSQDELEDQVEKIMNEIY